MAMVSVRRTAVLLSLLAALALALAGCGDGEDRRRAAPAPTSSGTPEEPVGSPVPTATAPDDRTARYQPLLDRRAAALEDGSADEMVRTAVGARQRARDRRAAVRSRGLDLRDVTYRIADVRRSGSGALLQVVQGYRIAGVDSRYEAARTLSVTDTGAGPRVQDEELLGRERQPWEVDTFVRRRVGHFVLLVPSGLDPEQVGLGAALTAGWKAISEALPDQRPPDPTLVLVARNATAARRLTGSISGVASLAAITDSRVRQAGPTQRAVEVVSQRMLTMWPVLEDILPEQRQQIITHELTHAALAEATSGRVPSWLTEGIAMHVSGDDRTVSAARALGAGAGHPAATALRERSMRLGELAGATAIGDLTGDAKTLAYAYASAATERLVAQYGRDAPLRLLRRFRLERIEGAGGTRRLTDRALRDAFGVSLTTFERRLKAQLRADPDA